MSEIVVAADGLTKRYGAVTAVDDLSLEVARGEFVSLLGPSGCGKTTLLRLIAGFVAPDAGRLRIAGRDTTRLAPAKRNVGLVFQDYSLWPHMTVADNVGFGLDCWGVRGRERTRRVEECLGLVRLSDLAGRLPRELSGGQQQRVALARALAYRPDVLLLDEPLSALDRKLREEMQAELRRLQHELHVTTILVTHDQEEALSLSDRVAVMSAGRIEHLGTPEEVYSRPRTRFVAGFVGRANMLAGTVTLDGAGALIFSGPAGLRVPMPARAAPEGPALALLRPEHLHLASPGTQPLLEARIADRSFIGAVVQITLEARDGTVLLMSATSTTRAALTLMVGSTIAVTFPPENLTFMGSC